MFVQTSIYVFFLYVCINSLLSYRPQNIEQVKHIFSTELVGDLELFDLYTESSKLIYFNIL